MTSGFSCVLLADAAVGLIMRSRKLPSTGAVGFLFEVWDVRDSGRAAREGRGVGLEAAGFTRVVVGAGLDGAVVVWACSSLARDAAVGAVKREDTSAGFVTSRGFALAVGDVCLSAAAARATDAAVGAVRELLLAFLLRPLWEVADVAGLAWFGGDLTELGAGFDAVLVELAAGLLLVALVFVA